MVELVVEVVAVAVELPVMAVVEEGAAEVEGPRRLQLRPRDCRR